MHVELKLIVVVDMNSCLTFAEKSSLTNIVGTDGDQAGTLLLIFLYRGYIHAISVPQRLGWHCGALSVPHRLFLWRFRSNGVVASINPGGAIHKKGKRCINWSH